MLFLANCPALFYGSDIDAFCRTDCVSSKDSDIGEAAHTHTHTQVERWNITQHSDIGCPSSVSRMEE